MNQISLDRNRENILIALQDEQTRSGSISHEFMADLASRLNVPVNDVFGVASFYSFIGVKPLGRNVIRVCRSLPCHMKNGQAVIDAIEKKLGIKPGRTTTDGRYSFELTNCIGLCDNAPAMLVNGDPHVGLTPEKVADILENYE
jgi:NADH:ubiquinone oxidoreductase subunit E